AARHSPKWASRRRRSTPPWRPSSDRCRPPPARAIRPARGRTRRHTHRAWNDGASPWSPPPATARQSRAPPEPERRLYGDGKKAVNTPMVSCVAGGRRSGLTWLRALEPGTADHRRERRGPRGLEPVHRVDGQGIRTSDLAQEGDLAEIGRRRRADPVPRAP